MAIYKLENDLYQQPCTLIAIHSVLHDYRLVYHLNSLLGIKLKATISKVKNSPDNVFRIFTWFDRQNEVFWEIVKNKALEQTKKEVSNKLFNSTYKIINYIPEYKNVDYILKIDEDGLYSKANAVLCVLKQHRDIITAYKLDFKKLKINIT